MLRTENAQGIRMGDGTEARLWIHFRPLQTRLVGGEWFIGGAAQRRGESVRRKNKTPGSRMAKPGGCRSVVLVSGMADPARGTRATSQQRLLHRDLARLDGLVLRERDAEHAVAQLADEVAVALAEVHRARVFGKLGVKSAAELAGWLASA